MKKLRYVLNVLVITGLFLTVIPVLAASGTSRCANVFSGAQDFNVYVFGDIHQNGSDTEGRMAAGGNIYLSDYSVGLKLSNSNGTRNDLISGDTIFFTNGKVENGNALSVNDSVFGNDVEFPHGSYKKGSEINFPALNAILTNNSTNLAALSSNGTATLAYSALSFNGSLNSNIFNVSSSDLSNASNIQFNVPSSSTVLINVTGNTVNLQNVGFDMNGVLPSNVLFNMPNVTNLNMSGLSMRGSLLAPLAHVNFNNAVMQGNIAANTLDGNAQFNTGQFNTAPFTGCIGGDEPPITETINPTVTISEPPVSPTITVSPIPTITPTTTPTVVPTTVVPTTVVTTTPTSGAVLGASTVAGGAVLADTGDSVIFSIILAAFLLVCLGIINGTKLKLNLFRKN